MLIFAYFLNTDFHANHFIPSGYPENMGSMAWRGEPDSSGSEASKQDDDLPIESKSGTPRSMVNFVVGAEMYASFSNFKTINKRLIF